MKYYIVSENELNDLSRTWSYAPGPHKLIDTTKAEAACRVRPVPDELDMIVGYSTPNPNEIKIWNRDEKGILE